MTRRERLERDFGNQVENQTGIEDWPAFVEDAEAELRALWAVLDAARDNKAVWVEDARLAPLHAAIDAYDAQEQSQ